MLRAMSLVAALTSGAAAALTFLQPASTDPAAPALAVLRESKDPDELLAAAELVCDVGNPDAVHQLTSLLLKPSFLGQLDPDDEYLYKDFRDLRITKALTAVAHLPGAIAAEVLECCARDACFTGYEKRMDALAYSVREVHNPSPFLLRFLDEQATSKNGGGMAAQSLARMATDESCALLEKRFRSQDYKAGDKCGWLLEDLIVVRDRSAVVALYRRLLESKIEDKKVRETLVQSLFDYRPWDWYGTEYNRECEPPAWSRYSTAVLKELLGVADTAEKLDVSAEAKEGVAKARQVIEAVLAGRERRAAFDQPGPGAASTRDLAAPLTTLRESKNPDVLVVAAEEVCDSHNADAIDRLTSLLLKPSLLERLDSADDYRRKSFRDMRILRVLTPLAHLPGAAAEVNLGRCGRDPGFMRSRPRALAFIYAVGEMRDPSPILLRLVDEQGAPTNGSTLVVRSLARLATDESCALIEKRMSSRDYDAGEKADWLESDLILVRDRPAVVALYKRLAESKISDREVREALVQSLFSYQPGRWYGSPDAAPPKWKNCSTPVLVELLRVADVAEKLDVSDDAKAGVVKARKQIETVLAIRQVKK